MILYAITQDLRPLLDAVDEAGGELTPADLDRLDRLLPAMDAKVDGIGKLIRTWEALAAARKAEAQRLQSGAAVLEGNARRLKEYLRSCLDVAGMRDHETALFKVWRQRSTPSAKCLLADLSGVPDRFKNQLVTPNLRAVLDEWRNTGAVPDGFAVEQGEHLRIR